MALNFTDTLTKVADDINKPPLQPTGTYAWIIDRHPEVVENFKDTWDVVNFHCRCAGAQEDVDPDALREFGMPLQNVRQRVSFFFSRSEEADYARAEYNIKRFLRDHVKCWNGNETLSQALANSVNQSFLGEIKWKADKDNPENFNANIGKTAPLPA